MSRSTSSHASYCSERIALQSHRLTCTERRRSSEARGDAVVAGDVADVTQDGHCGGRLEDLSDHLGDGLRRQLLDRLHKFGHRLPARRGKTAHPSTMPIIICAPRHDNGCDTKKDACEMLQNAITDERFRMIPVCLMISSSKSRHTYSVKAAWQKNASGED